MADSHNGWGWAARTPRITVHTGAARRWLLPAALISGAFLGLALLLLLSEPGAVGSPRQATNAWSTATGVSARTSFLAGCETHGTSVGVCVCMFDEVTGQAAYSTPNAFASLDLEGATPAPGAARVLAGATQVCSSAPAGLPASAPPAPSGVSGGPAKNHPV
jgi:hypothetical protein